MLGFIELHRLLYDDTTLGLIVLDATEASTLNEGFDIESWGTTITLSGAYEFPCLVVISRTDLCQTELPFEKVARVLPGLDIRSNIVTSASTGQGEYVNQIIPSVSWMNSLKEE